MKIYFARHGQYDNPDKVVPYRLPGFPLTELGRSQAQFQSKKLINAKIRTLSTSPIERCVETATIIAQTIHLHPNIQSELLERTEDESRESIVTRMAEFVGKLKLMSKNSTHLIVSHGDPITFYLSHVTQKSLELIPMGGLVMLDYRQKGVPKYSKII